MRVATPTAKTKNVCKDFASRDFVLREAELRDADEIHDILKQAFKGLEGRGYSARAIEAAVISAEEIRKRILLGEQVIVAELGNEIIGTVTGVEEHESMHVCSLAVHPKYQNRGVAKQLMKHLEKIAHDKKCHKLFLCTAWSMTEAIRLYETLGYEEEGHLRRYFCGEDFIVFSRFIKRREN